VCVFRKEMEELVAHIFGGTSPIDSDEKEEKEEKEDSGIRSLIPHRGHIALSEHPVHGCTVKEEGVAAGGGGFEEEGSGWRELAGAVFELSDLDGAGETTFVFSRTFSGSAVRGTRLLGDDHLIASIFSG
jgi:hypothetical protein